MADVNGRALRYRVVVADKLGRLLLPDEIVHHIDGDPSNDDPANLQVMAVREHARLHGKIAYQKLLKEIGAGERKD